MDPISKITRAKRVGGIAQAVECLPSKHKALSSNPMPQKKKKNGNIKSYRKPVTTFFKKKWPLAN
jgi:hypothetical protein